jgi:hypothetical protein
MLQKSSASPIFGLTARPLLAHSESSLCHARELLLTFASGKIVSPPSSTSDLFQMRICFRTQLRSHITEELGDRDTVIYLQIHEDSGHPLTTILGVELIKEIVKVRFVLLPNFIVKDLESLSIFCKPAWINIIKPLMNFKKVKTT